MRYRTRRAVRTAIAVLGVAAMTMVSACHGSSGGATSSGSSGSLMIAADDGSPTFARNFNPFSPNTRLGATYMYEPLEVVNTLDGKATPFLATGAKFTSPTTLVYTIRRGVTWSDGKPFTPADVVFSFDLVRRVPALDLHGDWQHISSVAAQGNTVIFHLKSADAPAEFVLDQQLIVPEHIWAGIKNPLTYTNPNPVVTGPYVLGTFAPNQYSLKKNPKYWQASKVAADEVIFPASNTQLNIVHNGYDWAYAFIPDVDKTWVGADRSHNTYWFPPGGTIGLVPNVTKAPLNDPSVRQGLSLALNRSKVADDAEDGYVQAAGQSGLILPSEKAWLDPALPDGGAVAQNTSAALQAFGKAGYHESGGKLVDRAGKQLALTIMTANGYTDWLQGLQAVRSQLSALGIAVTITQPQPAAYQQNLNNGDFDLAMSAFGGTGSVFQDYNTMLNSAFATKIGTPTSANFGRFSDSQADALLTQLKRAADPAAQQQIVSQLQQIVYKQTPVIAMFYGGLWGLFSTKDFTGWPSAKDPYAPPSTWNSTPLLVLTHIKKA
jgi:peptide/nickel transport system substrate-binding protein